ncbi:MAG: glycosyltransferase family 2 protein [Candidatus Cloacimonetes bacterium]|nr:glycosyltransferase family 2 protein [Candidatus Cloacimonadota bacterium]
MKKEMFFSVIVPCFNAHKTIERAIDSVLNQSYQNFELILIDDKSTDNTLEIVGKYSDPRIRLIKLNQNSGPSVARNTGWNMAKGDFIAFLDADDIWHKNKLEIVKIILTENRIDFLAHGYSVNDFQFRNSEIDVNVHARKYHYFKLMLLNIACTPGVVIKTCVKERFNQEMRYCEDHELFVRLAIKYDFYFTPTKLTTLGRPVLSKGGLSSRRLDMRLGELKMYLNIARIKQWLYLLMPLLLLFSFVKHIANFCESMFNH